MSTTEADAMPDDRASVCVFAPSPLLTVTVEHDVHEFDQLHVHVGGQGLWIARMVRTLGMRPQLCAVFGGETGQVARYLAQLGLHRRVKATSIGDLLNEAEAGAT